MIVMWKDIEGYAGRYQVSSIGDIFSHKVGRRLKVSTNKKGYNVIQLSCNGVSKSILVHRLVALHFIPNPKNKAQVNHKDCNKLNNHVTNLEWVTNEENQRHSWKNGRKPVKGNKHYYTKFTEEDIRYIRKARKEGVKLATLARKFKVGTSTISAIAIKQNWKHVND